MSQVATKIALRPLGDRVLIKPIETGEVKKGSIIIPDTAKEKPNEGEVVAVGKGKTTDEGKVLTMDLKVGDKVLFGKYAGTEIKLNDEDLFVMHQEDVLGIIT